MVVTVVSARSANIASPLDILFAPNSESRKCNLLTRKERNLNSQGELSHLDFSNL